MPLLFYSLSPRKKRFTKVITCSYHLTIKWLTRGTNTYVKWNETWSSLWFNGWQYFSYDCPQRTNSNRKFGVKRQIHAVYSVEFKRQFTLSRAFMHNCLAKFKNVLSLWINSFCTIRAPFTLPQSLLSWIFLTLYSVHRSEKYFSSFIFCQQREYHRGSKNTKYQTIWE